MRYLVARIENRALPIKEYVIFGELESAQVFKKALLAAWPHGEVRIWEEVE